MKKIQIYLPEEIYEECVLAADINENTVPSLIREWIIKKVEKNNRKGRDFLEELSKYHVKGGKTLSNDIDKIVYKYGK